MLSRPKYFVEHDFSKNPTSAFRIVFKRRNGAFRCGPQAEFSGVSPSSAAKLGTWLRPNRRLAPSGPVLVSTILAR
jgi:hypothetical protein